MAVLDFSPVLTGFLQATQAVKVKFEIDKKSSSNVKFVKVSEFFKVVSVSFCIWRAFVPKNISLNP